MEAETTFLSKRGFRLAYFYLLPFYFFLAFATIPRVQSFTPKFGNLKRPRREGQTVTVGRVADVPEGRGATVELLNGTELALYNVGGEFYAIENFCPHKGAPLADGRLCGHSVECDWHGWRFDLRTGACLNRPAETVETYEVIIEDGWIKIRV
jgi:nitrite reductase/ring-hydroxylating ferredoxin subunit